MMTMRPFLGLVLLLAAGVLRADNGEDRNKPEDRWVEIPAEVRAVRMVERLGGKVERDEQAPGQPIVWVSLCGTQATDEDLKDLAALCQLRGLNLDGTNITDAGLKELSALGQLQILALGGTKVTANGMQELHQVLPHCNILLL